jgi:hypothetical protein
MKMSLKRLKMLYGFVLLTMLSILGGIIAMGKVEQATSYGLLPIITALATLSGSFANWAFGESRDDTKKEKPDA